MKDKFEIRRGTKFDTLRGLLIVTDIRVECVDGNSTTVVFLEGKEDCTHRYGLNSLVAKINPRTFKISS